MLSTETNNMVQSSAFTASHEYEASRQGEGGSHEAGSHEAPAAIARPHGSSIPTEEDTGRQGLYVRGGKRLFDLTLGATILILCSPLLLVVALALRLSLGSEILFRQQRVGRDGRPFECLKFRTMGHDRRSAADQLEGPDRRATHKSSADPRHTPVGRKLRKFSLDELPQLWNLIRGDMSLVGPRPELVGQSSVEFTAHDRHSVRPGLTGYFQLSDLRQEGCLRAGLHLDEQYLHDISFGADCRVLMRTARVVLRGTGA